MYQDAGYGENWQPAANNARRIDPYTRSCAVLASLFAIGFVLIVIVVLSLIPLYISHNSSTTTTNNNVQVAKIFVNNYNLQFQPPFNNFDSQTILSDTNNRQTLQAALTSMIQKDSIMAGSVIDIDASSIKSNRKRRQTSNLFNLTFDLNIISNKSCSFAICLDQFHSHAINLLTNSNKVTPIARYQQSNSAQIYWIYYQLPQTIQSNGSFISVDLATLSSLLNTLIQIDNTQNQPSIENSTSNIIG